MKLPLKISPAFPSDVCDDTGSLIAMCCDKTEAAQITSAVNRHQSMVGALEVFYDGRPDVALPQADDIGHK